MLSSVLRALHSHLGSGSRSPAGLSWSPKSAHHGASSGRNLRESESCFGLHSSGRRDFDRCCDNKPLLPFDLDFVCFSYELARSAFLY